MTIKLTNGTYETAGGVPRTITGQEELLQAVSLRLCCKQGAFRYGRAYGSLLHTLELTAEHATEQAVSLANEAILDLAGVTVLSAHIEKTALSFTVQTPYGTGEVTYGAIRDDTTENAGAL